MDFVVAGSGNLVCSNSAIAAPNNGSFASENAAEAHKHKLYGSGVLKQERAINEDDFRDFKVAKTSFCGEATLKIPSQRSNGSSFAEGHVQMLSFSSLSSQTSTSPYYLHTSSAFGRNTGHGFAGINAAGMQGVTSGDRGPFTPSQWRELEHQALIYKYITENVPIPSSLLNPIRKAFESACFSSFPGPRTNGLGWGAFHLGFCSTDPEPGRCRRTDGKKWRCSREAVPDQKYCERHMNRGRHRSRKPVEGQPGHSASGTTTTNNAKLTPMASSASASVVPAGGGASNNFGLSHHHQLVSSQQPASNTRLFPNRSLLEKEIADGAYQRTPVLCSTSPKVSLKENHCAAPEQYHESTRQEFGSVRFDSLLNPLNKSSTALVNFANYCTSSNTSDQENNKSQHALGHCTDDLTKNQLDRPAISWPNVDLQPDGTQLSISIPMAASNFLSSTSSPTNGKLTGSPLGLSQELQMGLGMGTFGSEKNQRQTMSLVPVSWESSMGGPLGEVLHTSSNGTENTVPLNLVDSCWDNGPRFASSPTGVLQRGFGSLSNSSAGSSPGTESSKTLDGASLGNGFISPGLMNPSLPAL